MALRARAHSSVLSLGVTPHEIWCRRSQDRNNPMTMGAQVRTRRFGVYLRPATAADPDVPAGVVSWLRSRNEDGAKLVAVCSGAFILAATSLAAGRSERFARRAGRPIPGQCAKCESSLDRGRRLV